MSGGGRRRLARQGNDQWRPKDCEPWQQGLTPRPGANSSAKQLDIAVGHPCKTLKVMRREILNGRTGRDHLSLVAGNAETNFEKASSRVARIC